MGNNSRTKYFKTHRVEELEKIFYKKPTKKWIESKLLYCFDLESLSDITEISSDIKDTTIKRISLLTNEITEYLQNFIVKRNFRKYQNTFYKCLIILKYFANLYGYTIFRRVEQISLTHSKTYYSLVSINKLSESDFIPREEEKRYFYKPLYILHTENKTISNIKIYKNETIKISFE